MDIRLLVSRGASWMQGTEGRGCQQEVGMGVPAEAPRWDARLISIQDGWEEEEEDG